MQPLSVPGIEPLGICAKEPLHPRYQICLRRLQQPVKVLLFSSTYACIHHPVLLHTSLVVFTNNS
jgi:hypothetical protein